VNVTDRQQMPHANERNNQ